MYVEKFLQFTRACCSSNWASLIVSKSLCVPDQLRVVREVEIGHEVAEVVGGDVHALLVSLVRAYRR